MLSPGKLRAIQDAQSLVRNNSVEFLVLHSVVEQVQWEEVSSEHSESPTFTFIRVDTS